MANPFHVPWRIDRKRGERHKFSTKDSFTQRVTENPITIYIESTHKVEAHSDYLIFLPNGDYDVRGPKGKKVKWTANLNINRENVGSPYTVT